MFLELLKHNGLLEDGIKSGLVLYADDQFIHLDQVKMKFAVIGQVDKLRLFDDGKEVVDFIGNLLDET